MTIQEEQLSMHEKDLQRLNELCLMDDDFFSEALDGKKEAVGYILNTVLEREDLKVVSTSAQVEYKSATKRSIRLDIKAEDVKYLKETEGGKGQMSRILEEMREEAEHKKAIETARKMLERGRDSVEDIAEITGLTLKEVQELAS